MNEDWEPLLERYLDYAARYYVAVRRPSMAAAATAEQLAFLQSEGRHQNLYIDPSIERLLARVNGVGYDGFWFYGIQIPKPDTFGRMDLLYMNRLVEERGQDTLYGQWTDQFFVHVADTGTFARRSIAGWNPYDEYETCNQMITAIFEEMVGYLEDRWD